MGILFDYWFILCNLLLFNEPTYVLLPPYFLLLVSFLYFLYDLYIILSAISLNKTTVIVFMNVKLNHNMPDTFNL